MYTVTLLPPPRARALSPLSLRYTELTVAMYTYSADPEAHLGKLSVGRCADIGYGVRAYATNGVPWAPASLMNPICKQQCNCTYNGGRADPFNHCPDADDQPLLGKWCSLCGPSVNQDATITLYTKGPAPPPPPPAVKNVVDLVQSSTNLSTLAFAIGKAGLADTLSGAGPFTVLAPVNDAFAKLDPATLKHLLDPANVKELQAILELHVVPGRIQAADFFTYEQLPTINGLKISVHIFGRDDEVEFSADDSPGHDGHFSRVISIDNEATNGVVHFIDAVLTAP